MSSSSRQLHFGLGAETKVREIEARWPSGAISRLHDVSADQVLTMVEPRENDF
jgi:hypothetical protein